MQKQRIAFSDFIRSLADIYRPRGVDIIVVKCEDLRLAYSGRPTQEMLDDEVGKSDVLVALFNKKCGEKTIEEFDVARTSLAARNKPIIIVAFKNTQARSTELESFRSKIDKELGLYYWTFGTKEKLHFDFVMWFLQSEFAVGADPVIVEDGTVKVGSLPVAKFSQLPFAANNTEYNRLEEQLNGLKQDIEQLRQDVAEYPENKKFSARLSQKLNARGKLQEEVQRQQEALLGAAKRIAELRKQQVSDKLEKAADAFENGQLEVANTYLDELKQEGAQLYREIQSRREELKVKEEQMHDHIEALKLQTQTVMADAGKSIGERIIQIAAIYAEADKWAASSNYPEDKYDKLLFDYAQFLYQYAHYPKAVEIYLRHISLSEKLYGTDHPDTATSYNNIGAVYKEQGDYDQALKFYKKALEIKKKVLGEDHPSTATSYNNIGVVYKEQGDYAQALKYYKKALEIDERMLGKDHPDTATPYNNIGAVYKARGDYAQALKYYKKALGIKKKVLGEDHPDTATSYNNIGGVYDEQGDYAQALEYYKKALEIKKKVLGEEHPNTATSYNNIGWVYREQGDYKLALEYYEKSYVILQQKLGEDHPHTKSVKLSIEIMKSKLGLE